jgi:hypothetical protein
MAVEFTIGDYKYRVITGDYNVYAETVDKTKSSYGSISATVTYNNTTYYVVGAPHCFEGCTNLTSVPSISLSAGQPNFPSPGYHVMTSFLEGCTSLATVDIDAICSDQPLYCTISSFCEGCTSLTTAKLPAYAMHGCSSAFRGCTALTSVDRIPALYNATSARTGYGHMFDGCTSLASVPDFPEAIDSDYIKMGDCFRNCTSLVEAPQLPSLAKELDYCFENCTSLEEAPTIPSGVTKISYCFHNCTSLETPPSIPSSVNAMDSCFYGCKNLTSAPTIPSGVDSLYYCFSGCEKLAAAPAIPSGVTDMHACFQTCRALVTAPAIPDGVTDMGFCFSGCYNLEDAPDIPASVTAMNYCFGYCQKMTGTISVENTPTSYAYAFTGTREEISIALNGTADVAVWSGIASQYANVYIVTANSRPTVVIDAFRSDSNGDASEDGTYAYVTVEVTLYEDYVPAGSNDVRSLTFKIDGTTSAQTWTETTVGLTHTFTAVVSLGDTSKHTLTASAEDDLRHTSTPVSIVLVSAAPALDFVHGSTDNGAAFGRLATLEGVLDNAWDYYEHGERAYPTFTRSSWSISSDESTLPVTPCFVLSTGDGALYWCDGVTS